MKPLDAQGSGPRRSRRVCSVCGKPSDQRICDPCATRIRLDAMARKTHEENGSAWAKWESPDVAHKHRRSNRFTSQS